MRNPKEIVVCYHPIAAQAGYEILDQGGNAFDAFVAATAAEYVLGEGVTSLGGPLGVLVFDAKTKTTAYLDAGFNQPLAADQKWDPNQPGSAVLVPGAPAGLEALSKKFGRLPFDKVLEPAIRLAENGFPINPLYAHLIKAPKYSALLKQSEYGQRTFFKDGAPLREGDELKLPELARFLKRMATQGSSFVYKGQWAQDALEAVNQRGGHVRPEDFSAYMPRWEVPWRISYRGVDIEAPANGGGLDSLLSLKVLERANITRLGEHFSKSADALELLIRIQNEVRSEAWLYDPEKLRDRAWLNSMFSSSHVDKLWKRVQSKLASTPQADTGSHSYHIVVIDRDGNAATGTNTIESMPWGSGIFVEGVPLTSSGNLAYTAKPGARRLSPLSMQIGLKNSAVRFASGAFASSLHAAAFQFVTNMVDYQLSPLETVTLPRFGNLAFDFNTLKPTGGRWADPRIDSKVVQTLKDRGIGLTQDGYIDTGLGSVAVVNDVGDVEGATAPLTGVGYVSRKIAGVGISLESKQGGTFVNHLVPGSPAERSGAIRPGDRLIAIEPQGDLNGSWSSISEKRIEDVLPLIQGKEGTPIALRFARDSKEFTVKLIRSPLQ